MLCPFCFQKSTKVTNSRPSKTLPRIWRRRHCIRCGHTITTYERVSAKELPLVEDSHDAPSTYSEARLMISIWRELPESSPSRADDAEALAQTVTERLIVNNQQSLTTSLIATTTYQTMTAFHPNSGARYGLTHAVITNLKPPKAPRG